MSYQMKITCHYTDPRLQHVRNGILTCVKLLLRRNSTQRKSNKTVSVEGLHAETFKRPQYAELLSSCTMFTEWGNLDQNRNKHYAKLHRAEIIFRSQLAYVDSAWEYPFAWCTCTLEIRGFNLTVSWYKEMREERKGSGYYKILWNQTLLPQTLLTLSSRECKTIAPRTHQYKKAQATETCCDRDQFWSITQILSYPVIKLHIHVFPKSAGVVIPKGFCISKGLKWKRLEKNN